MGHLTAVKTNVKYDELNYRLKVDNSNFLQYEHFVHEPMTPLYINNLGPNLAFLMANTGTRPSNF